VRRCEKQYEYGVLLLTPDRSGIVGHDIAGSCTSMYNDQVLEESLVLVGS
jgi:hypothetical protein